VQPFDRALAWDALCRPLGDRVPYLAELLQARQVRLVAQTANRMLLLVSPAVEWQPSSRRTEQG
jgi:hypothetical protein